MAHNALSDFVGDVNKYTPDTRPVEADFHFAVIEMVRVFKCGNVTRADVEAYEKELQYIVDEIMMRLSE